MRNILESLGISVPKGATSYHTEGAVIMFCIGETGRFVDMVMDKRQIDALQSAECSGSFGCGL